MNLQITVSWHILITEKSVCEGASTETKKKSIAAKESIAIKYVLQIIEINQMELSSAACLLTYERSLELNWVVTYRVNIGFDWAREY